MSTERIARHSRIKINKLVFTFLLFALLLVYSYPVFLTILTSLKNDAEVIQNPIGLPIQVSFSSFTRAWDLLGMGKLMLYSLLYSIGGTLLAILITIGPAYALGRFKIPGGNIIFVILITGLMVPQQTVVIPLYEVLTKLGLLNLPLGLIIVHGVYGIAFVLLILRGFIGSVPRELEDAARVDGCDDFRLLLDIFLPLLMPGILVAGVLNIINIWRELFFSLIFLNNESVYPVTVGLIKVTQSNYFSSWNLPAAAVLISQIPIVLIYIVAYQWIQKGVMAGAVKG